jgi:hypothetical protein
LFLYGRISFSKKSGSAPIVAGALSRIGVGESL